MEEYEEILTRKLNPRDQAKVLLDYTKSKVTIDQDSNSRVYSMMNYFISQSENGTILPDDDIESLISGMTNKLDFLSKIMVEKVLKTCNNMLSTACSEQGDLLSFVVQEFQKSLIMFTSITKKLNSMMVLLKNEKNVFASKALSMAKAVRSVYYHDVELTCLQPSASFYTLLSDICLSHRVSIPVALEKMFVNLGGTSKCNRYKSNNDNQQEQEKDQQEQQDSYQGITSINDMVAFIETNYTSKIMSIFLSDAKTTVEKIIEEINAKRELELKKTKLNQLQAQRIAHTPHVPRSRPMLSSEAASELLIQQMVSQRRAKAAFTIQCCRYRYKQRKRIQQRRIHFASMCLARFFRVSKLKSILHRKVVQSFIKKVARRRIRRVCLKYFLRVKLQKWAAKILTRNIKRLWRNHLCKKYVALVKYLSRNIVQRSWLIKWGSLEKRLERVELYIDTCSPITLAQHAVMNSKSLQDSKLEQDLFHERLVAMSKWNLYEECEDGFEQLIVDHENMLVRVSVSPTALDGFEISDIVKDSVRSIEERCNIFSIIGSSVLRYGSHIPNPPLPPTSTKEQKANRPSTTPNRKKNATRNRAQTAAAVSNSQQLSSTGPIKLINPRSSQRSPIRATPPPSDRKPSQVQFRRTQIQNSTPQIITNSSTELNQESNSQINESRIELLSRSHSLASSTTSDVESEQIPIIQPPNHHRESINSIKIQPKLEQSNFKSQSNQPNPSSSSSTTTENISHREKINTVLLKLKEMNNELL